MILIGNFGSMEILTNSATERLNHKNEMTKAEITFLLRRLKAVLILFFQKGVCSYNYIKKSGNL